MNIKKLAVRNFKAFESFDIDFGPFNVFVGANNSGKSTIFHALRFVFWLVEVTARENNGRVSFQKSHRINSIRSR